MTVGEQPWEDVLGRLRLSLATVAANCHTRRWSEAAGELKRVCVEIEELDAALRAAADADPRP